MRFPAEARQVMENVGQLLQEQQLGFDDLVNVISGVAFLGSGV